MNKINIISVTLIILLFTGCKKDFLDINPLATETVAYYKTQDGATEAVSGCYNVLTWDRTWGRDQWAFGDVASDDAQAGGASMSDQIDMQYLDQFNIFTNNLYCTEFWDCLYAGVARCNAVTTYVPQGSFSQTLINQYVGEAEFLRALYFFNLAITYGPVPVFSTALTQSQYTMGQGTSFAPVWAQIESDLRDAMSKLPEKSGYASTDLGRATTGAARALLMKVLIYESSYAKYGTAGMYNGCIQRWSDVITLYENSDLQLNNTSQYVLMNVDTTGIGNPVDQYRAYGAAFGNLFSIHNKNNSESIFEVQSMFDNQDNTYTNTSNQTFNHSTNPGNILAIYQMSRNRTQKNGTVSQGLGWGFNCPTGSLYTEFELVKKSGSTNIYDPRLTATIATNKDTFQFGPTEWDYYNNSTSPTGYCARKYYVSGVDWNPVNKGMSQDQNIRIIRYTDALLFAAEAYMEIDPNSTQAWDILAAIRARVGLTTDRTKDLKTAIYHERRVELALEGHRFYDVVRTGRGATLLTNAGLTGYSPFQPGKNERFPIPESDISYSGGNLKQNPGY